MKKEDVQEIVQDALFEIECFFSSLTFLVLKFTEVITGSWVWTLFPMWILIAIKIIAYKSKDSK